MWNEGRESCREMGAGDKAVERERLGECDGEGRKRGGERSEGGEKGGERKIKGD